MSYTPNLYTGLPDLAGGGGVSLSADNTWTGQQTFYNADFNSIDGVVVPLQSRQLFSGSSNLAEWYTALGNLYTSIDHNAKLHAKFSTLTSPIFLDDVDLTLASVTAGVIRADGYVARATTGGYDGMTFDVTDGEDKVFLQTNDNVGLTLDHSQNVGIPYVLSNYNAIPVKLGVTGSVQADAFEFYDGFGNYWQIGDPDRIGGLIINFNFGGVFAMASDGSIFTYGNISVNEGQVIQFGTTTGGNIAGTTSEKWAAHGATPVEQRASAAQAAVATTGATNVAPYGFTTAAQANAIVTLVNEMRAWAVQKGMIKGSA